MAVPTWAHCSWTELSHHPTLGDCCAQGSGGDTKCPSPSPPDGAAAVTVLVVAFKCPFCRIYGVGFLYLGLRHLLDLLWTWPCGSG